MRPSAHYWTILPVVLERLQPLKLPFATYWEHAIEDPDVGKIHLTGELRRHSTSRDLLILVHGLGGCVRSRYISKAVLKADRAGLSTLLLNLRGCDRRGEDLYHAGLTSDLADVLNHAALADFDRIFLLGFSLGGHLVLRFATEVEEPRVSAVAAVCSPLDLSRAVDVFDQPPAWIYRQHILRALREIYTAVERHRTLPTTLQALQQTTKLRDFDSQVVVPRFGFADVNDYYQRASVSSRLDQLRVPALLVAAENDPIVDRSAISTALDRPYENLRVVWTPEGGHVSFPPDLDLSLGPELGVEAQIFHWLRDR